MESEKHVSFKKKALEEYLNSPLPIEETARSLSDETLELLVGKDEWEMNEFANRLQAWALDPSTPDTNVARATEILHKIKEAETENAQDKSDVINKLGDELHSLTQ